MNYGNTAQAAQVTGQKQQGDIRGTRLGESLLDTKPKRESFLIPQALDLLEHELYCLGEVMNELRNRLQPVCIPETPEVAKEQTAARDDIPMVNAINGATRMVRQQIYVAQSLVGRLEV